MANNGWRVARSYNQDVEDHVAEMNELTRKDNLKRYGANTITPYYNGKYLFCDEDGDTKFLGFFEELFYRFGWKENFKIKNKYYRY